MKTISDFNGLKDYGIICLTGESCGLGLRLLCDFTEKGKKVLTKTFGFDFKGAEPWNSSTGGEKHVGSVMLSWDMLKTISIFALLENGCSEVYTLSPQTYHGKIETLRRFQRAYALLEQYAHQLSDLKFTRDPNLKVQADELLKDIPRKDYRYFAEDIVYGVEPRDTEEDMEDWFKLADRCGWSPRRWAYQGTAGARYQHVMSGRIA